MADSIFVLASYGKIKSAENDRKIAVSAQKAPMVRLMENLGLDLNIPDPKRMPFNKRCERSHHLPSA